ncbi:MAG: DNA-directed RNA polymerase, subunit E'' [Candidatus Marsarchaeota archaeon]|nr:DNA-directed RNA polymerase, subunit E'' [Candidatus Marsarchaeota archaeon]MCL5434418.1 DNA-directed RNA polymerase, subunit E'' [Candidatus Marsarchaeota archaeon]
MEGLACKKCKIIISHGSKCPLCGSTELTNKWSGYIIVFNPEKSEVAKKLGIKISSTYALNIK